MSEDQTRRGYRIPTARARTETSDRGSRFIATADRVRSADAARDLIHSIRAEMPDASHHCYAFAAGHGATVTHGMSDAGEPSGTAGRPILAVVNGSGIGDLVVVVTRYFGGTKLGTGGLVRAYTKAAQSVLEVLQTGLAIEQVQARLDVPYHMNDALRHQLEKHGVKVLSADYGADVMLRVQLAADRVATVQATLNEISSGTLALIDVTQIES